MDEDPQAVEDAAVELVRRVAAEYLETVSDLLASRGHLFESRLTASHAAMLHSGDKMTMHHLREAVRSCRRVSHGYPPGVDDPP